MVYVELSPSMCVKKIKAVMNMCFQASFIKWSLHLSGTLWLEDLLPWQSKVSLASSSPSSASTTSSGNPREWFVFVSKCVCCEALLWQTRPTFFLIFFFILSSWINWNFLLVENNPSSQLLREVESRASCFSYSYMFLPTVITMI